MRKVMLPAGSRASELYEILDLGNEFLREWIEGAARYGIHNPDIFSECLHKVEEWEKNLLKVADDRETPEDVRRLIISIAVPTAETARLLATYEAVRNALIVVSILEAIDDIIMHAMLPGAIPPLEEWVVDHVGSAAAALAKVEKSVIYEPAHQAITGISSTLDMALSALSDDAPYYDVLSRLRSELGAMQLNLIPTKEPALHTSVGLAAMLGCRNVEEFQKLTLLPNLDWKTTLLSLEAQLNSLQRIPGSMSPAKWVSYITALANMSISRAKEWGYPVPPPLRLLVIGGVVPSLVEPAESYYINGTADALSAWVIPPEGASPPYLLDCAAHELFPGHHFHASILRGKTLPSFGVSPHADLLTLDSILGNGASTVAEGWASFGEMLTVLKRCYPMLAGRTRKVITPIEKAFAYSCLKIVERYAWVSLESYESTAIKLERKLMPYQLASYWLGMLLWTAVFLDCAGNENKLLTYLHSSAFPTPSAPLEEAIPTALNFIENLLRFILEAE